MEKKNHPHVRKNIGIPKLEKKKLKKYSTWLSKIRFYLIIDLKMSGNFVNGRITRFETSRNWDTIIHV